MNKEIVCLYNGILLRHKEEQSPVTVTVWMELEIKWNKSGIQKENSEWSHSYVKSEKN